MKNSLQTSNARRHSLSKEPTPHSVNVSETRKLRRHSVSEANLFNSLSSSKRVSGVSAQAPPPTKPASARGIQTFIEGSMHLGRRGSFSSAASSGVMSRSESIGGVSSNASPVDQSRSRRHSFFVPSPDPSRNDLRKLAFKSVAGSLCSGEETFSRRLSSKTPSRLSSKTTSQDTESSSHCSPSNLSSVGLQILRPSTPSSQLLAEISQGDHPQLSSRSSTSSTVRSLSERPESLMFRDPPASQTAASRCHEKTAHDTRDLFEAISLSTVGYEGSVLALLSESDLTELNKKDLSNCTALHHAAGQGLLSVCRALLECESFMLANESDRIGRTALHCAAAAGHVKVCKFLLMHPRFSASNDSNSCGCTALHSAACGGSPEVCLELLNHSEFNVARAQDNDGETALHWAAWNGHAYVCQTLLEHPRFRTACNQRDHRGRTALHLAALHGLTEACCAIWKHDGIERDACTRDGLTVLEAARCAGHFETYTALQQLMA